MQTTNKRQYDKDYSRALRDEKNEVGHLPEIKKPELRERVIGSLECFLVELFPHLFFEEFGPAQRASIEHEERILVSGAGNLNKLEPRGYGKSTRSILSSVWACLRGSQDFILVCCDSVDKSTALLQMARSALGENQAVFDCFPELACFHHLEGNSHRCQYQTYKGKHTKINIKGDAIRFPVLGEGIDSEGAIIMATPFKKARGKNIEGKRPSIAILDDVQSSEDAGSPTTVSKLVKTLTTDISQLGSRTHPVAIINNATIIGANDYPSQVAELPAFTTVRYRMVESMPENLELWDAYQTIRQDYSQDHVDSRGRAAKEALEFYVKHREKMDKGSETSWDAAYSTAKDEISTIQAAMNFINDFGQEAFESECQNQPLVEKSAIEILPISEIMKRLNGVLECTVSLGHETVTAFIDVHEEILDFEVWSFDQYFGGAKVQGGTWPNQKRPTFNHTSPPVPLSYVYSGMPLEARIDAGLNDLIDLLLSREWIREDETPMRIARCLVDANGYHADTIKKACRMSEHAVTLTPSFGMGITAKRLPISRLPNNKNRLDIGPEWAPKKATKGEIPSVIFDANYWKTRFHTQLGMPKGEKGALMLHDARPVIHRRSAEAYCSEKPTKVSANGRTILEWELLPNKENHPLDCAVGCMVAASIAGVTTETRRSYRKSGHKTRTVKT